MYNDDDGSIFAWSCGRRLAGTEFDIAVFTNLTHDHLDFHGTMDNYGQAKGLLFSQLGQDLRKEKFAVVNADDEWSNKLLEMTSYPVFTYGIRNKQSFVDQILSYGQMVRHLRLLRPTVNSRLT